MTTSAENWSMEELSSVSIDDEKAGETIVDYLIEHGHTKIAEMEPIWSFTDSSSAT